MINWLTLEEAAQYLKMGQSTLYKMAQAGRAPAHKIGNSWRFDTAELDKWVKEGGPKPDSSKQTKEDMKKA